MDAEIILIIIKMLLGGIVAFLAILIMSKTRASSWMFMMCGFLFLYISLMFELFVSIGVLKEPPIYVLGFEYSPDIKLVYQTFKVIYK